MTVWPKKPFMWIVGRTLFISIPFTWNLPEIRRLCLQHDFRYDRIVVGGPAVKLMPHYLDGLAEIVDNLPGVLQLVNPQATRTTEGCPNRCGFCGVKKIYPKYREISDWSVRPIICDDNFMAASRAHKLSVINKLAALPYCDFNQGLEARRITTPWARLLAGLSCPIIRLAWDKIDDERHVIPAIERLLATGIPKRNVRCYILIGWHDTPAEARYRLETIEAMGVVPNPMRYTPLYTLERSRHVNIAKGWTEDLLMDYMKFWANRRFFRSIPFDKFNRLWRKSDGNDKNQTVFQETK